MATYGHRVTKISLLRQIAAARWHSVSHLPQRLHTNIFNGL